MADTLTYDNNNVYYVDPSDAFVQMDGENKHYVTPDTEDMCIAVDLEVECPKRYNRTNGLSKFILQWATSSGENTNFLGGTALDGEGTNTKLRYLTSDGNEYVYGDNQTQEMFGIKSIHIDYSTFFVPNITIEFSDVRGASLFTIEEANHQACTNGIKHSLNSVDVTRSFFECFFRFPYPKFRLKVKGLYGKPASYELTVAKCNHSLDATTGNYNVTATFIGYTYSLLNDITMNTLIAAPYAKDWGAEYWTSKFANKTLPDGSGTYKRISDMIADMAGASRKVGEIEKNIQSNNDSYNRRIADVVAMRKALTDIINPGGLMEQYFKNTSINGQTASYVYGDGQRMIVVNEHAEGSATTILATNRRPFDFFAKNENGDGYVNNSSLYNTKKEVVQLREAYNKFKNAYASYVLDKTGDDPDLPFGDIDRLTENSGAFGGFESYEISRDIPSRAKINVTNRTVFERLGRLMHSSNNISSAFLNDFTIDGTNSSSQSVQNTSNVVNLLSEYSDSTGNLINNQNFCFIDTIDYSYALSKLRDTEMMLRNSQRAEKDNVDLSNLYIDYLGFKPTIENIMAIVMAHFEVLLHGIKNCEDNVYSLLDSGNRKSENLEAGATVPPMTNGNVPPFPDVYTVDNRGRRIKTWIGANGINTTYAPEKNLIDTLLEAVDVIEENIEEAMRAENEFDLANFNSGTAEVPFPVSVTDFIKVRKPGEENYDDVTYSPFGKSINAIINGTKTSRKKALANILKTRWLNLGDSVEDKKGSGKVDAHNLMAMHRGDIISLDSLLDTLNGINGEELSKLAGKVCDEARENVFVVPAVGYSLSDVSRDADWINVNHLTSPFDTKYSLYKKGSSKYEEISYYNYRKYEEGIKAIKDANITEWETPEFYNPVEFVSNIASNETESANSVIELTTNNGIALEPLGNNFRLMYNVDINQIITPSGYPDDISKITLSYFDSAYIFGMGPIFGNRKFYETSDIDKQAEIFLEGVRLRFKKFGENSDNETALVANYAQVLWMGNQERLIRDGKSTTGIERASYDRLVKIYDKWRDTTFQKIKEKYALRKNNKTLTSEEVDALYNFITRTGKKDTDMQSVDMPTAAGDVSVTNNTSGYILDCFDKLEELDKYVDKNWFKETYGLTIFVRNTGTMSMLLTDTKTYPEEITLFARKNDFLTDASHELLTPVIVFQKYKIKGGTRINPDDYTLSIDYANGFIDELKKLIEAEKKTNDRYINNDINNNSDEGIGVDIRVALYTYIKTVYDKWLCGNKNYQEDYSVENFFEKHFYFIDSFYNKIGNDLIVNTKHILEEIDNSRRNKTMSMLEFITSVSSKNLVQTLCVQNFSDFSNSEHNVLEQAFKPLAYNDASMNTVISIPDFVFVYANQPSQHIDIKGDGDDEYEYENDGFHLSCDDSISDLCIEGKRQGKIPAFGVKYGTLYQHFFHDLQVGMDSSMATEQSMAAMFAIANINQNSDSGEIISPIGQDLYTIYSNNSYNCKIRMMGSAWVQPLMYFDLLNVPMFHGSYMIKKVTHSITPGDMVTEIVGVRQANVANKFVEHYMLSRRGTYIEERDAFEAKNAKPVNNCPYQMFDPRESDVADEDNNHTTNIAVLKTLSTEHEGKKYTYYDIIVNQVLGATNAVGHLKSNESHYRTTIPLMVGVMYTRIKWYNKDMGGWSNVLKATDDFPYMYTTFQQGSIPDDVMKTYILEIEEVLNNSPVSLVGEKKGILHAGREHTITARELSIMTHYDFTGELANEYLFSYNADVYMYGPFNNSGIAPCYEVGASDAVKRLRERSITNRTAEEEPYSDIAVGLQRSIKKTCEKTDSLSQWNPKFIQGTDSDTFIIDNLVSQDMADTMFDMLLNTYYDYIIRLEYITGNQKQIRVSAANLVDGVGPRRIFRMIQSNGQIVEAGEGNSKEPFTEGFLNAIYKKYLVGVDLDKILSSNSNVFMKECENFNANITTERIKNLFGDIKIEPCEEYTIREYNTDMSDGGMYENEWASVNHTYKGINLDSCNDNCSNVNCRDSNDPLYPSIEVYQNMLNTIDSIILVAKDWCSKNNCTLCISSFYRAPKRNRRVGGSVNSNHNKGYAVDLQVKKNGIINNDLTKSLFEYFKDLDENKKTVTIDGNSFVFSVNELLYEHNSRGSKWIHVSHKPSGDKHTIKDNYQSKH